MVALPLLARRAIWPAAFRHLAAANLATHLAEQISLAAVPIIAVLVLGAGAGESGLLQAAQRLPFLLLTIPAGLMADRASRTILLRGAELLRCSTLAAILVLWLLDALTLPLLAALGFLGAAGTVAFTVAAPALIPSLAGRDRLAAANGRIELARSAAFVSGPAIAGLVIGWSGAGAAFTIAATLSAIAVLLLLRLPEPVREANTARRSPLADLREGAAFVARHPHLRPIALTAIVFNTGFFVQQAIVVPYAHDHLGMSATAIGIVLALQGGGMLLGALVAGRLMAVARFGLVIRLGPLCGMLAAAIMLLTWWLPWPALAGLSYLVIGIGPMVWTVSSTTLRQVVTPDRLLGRVSAVITTATAGASPLGALLGAWLGSRFPLVVCLAVALGLLAVQFAIISRSRTARLHAIETA